ncbi:4-hydroxy-tetrahydrodipicolinate reductase [Natrarchaeobaculum sulfurireducens]|uniref:4-hydroxy-tetrahydrodipicolinate reductase n=1 Tax=Natrarchaeobaculum sulfurireducens TaxID=2044521 RepID=A0A346PU82_9EURY|nr:4-hydroxy-tetrahydrodipicolinate reductase [Natrarchaeobaculum sulfurireducens]AXR79303.1 Dihydrodipicolinate reductase [Natrarchaeobaculum sulfurireducens]AXR83077.1 4-hydroxy-tetrahydrodipicolinate reductase [Natrarchaeobaculum sulfurireducens]
MTVRIGVTGATGRMGREVIAAASDHDDCEVVLAVNRDPDVDRVDGVPVESAAEFDSLLADREPTAVVDFTGPESAADYARTCADAGVAFVTGTTGFAPVDRQALEDASETIPVLHAPNFARGVQALLSVVGEAVRNLPGYDVELVETHHNAKRDAPSGTANRLLEEIEAHGDFTGRKHGREGFDPREDGEIGVHVLRAGNVTGEHEIVIADNHEEVRLTHRAEDRGVFAAGAVDAAVWIAGAKAGWYDFADVIDE